MGRFENIFIDPSADTLFLPGTYDAGLVVLSVLVAVFSSIMALQIAHIARGAEIPLHRHVAIGTGAISLGGGIWTMHFIGMLSFQLCTAVHYGTGLTLLSVVPALAASWVALRRLSLPEVSGRQICVSGTLVGLGIATMHYSGMAAMQMGPQLRYDPARFALSIVLAAALAILAIWIRFGLGRSGLGAVQRLLAGGCVMGLAITGTHYVGMSAARFIGQPGAPDPGVVLNTTFASLALSTFTITVTVLVFAANGLIRYRLLFRRMGESESRIRAIVDTAVDGIITIDSRGIIQAFNQSAERLFGWQAHEVIGSNIKMLMPEPDQSRHDEYLDNYLVSGVPKIIGSGREVEGLHKDGSLIPIRLAVGRVELPGAPLFVGFVTNIAERRNLEKSLRKAAERAEQAASAKSTFLANMSHEIRTPMNAIIGFTELLLTGELTPLQRSHLTTIRQSSRSLLGLLNDILDTTRLEKGALELETIDFSLKEVTEHILASLRLSAQAKNLTLTMVYPAQMETYFKGDPLRIQQVLTNLIGNAIKFTERGTVSVEFLHENGLVHIRVRDTGIGMSEQQLQTIFDPFSQADASISRRFGGSGLGTTIARQLVELMAGSIYADSVPGQGSVFHVLLPLRRGARPGAQAADAGAVTLPQLDILIADDVPQNLELLTLMLTGRGHKVTAAGDGDQVVGLALGHRFDLVLMDMHMPGLDGLSATRRIRRHEQATHITPTPIIALTASVMDSDRRAAREAGMNGFAAKPLDPPKLLAEIARALGLDASPPSAGPDRQNADERPHLIDWTLGVSLWGSKARLAQALRTFLAEAAARHPLPDEHAPDIDWDATMFSLHGIRGAAGNLALPRVIELASTLEDKIRGGAREEVRQQLTRLRDMLAAAAEELRQSGALATAPAVAAVAPTMRSRGPQEEEGGEDEDSEAAGRQMEDLLACLARSELNVPALDAVSAWLRRRGRHAECDALNGAIDDFDFAQATALARTIQADFATHPSDSTA
ncbi:MULTISPECIES: MHYT domain-containing protein [Cupriavidus]